MVTISRTLRRVFFTELTNIEDLTEASDQAFWVKHKSFFKSVKSDHVLCQEKDDESYLVDENRIICDHVNWCRNYRQMEK